jgi:deoxyribonuclease-1
MQRKQLGKPWKAIVAGGLFLVLGLAYAAPQSFDQAKAELKKYVYFDQNMKNQEFYCGCNWQWVGASGGRIDHASCGYQVRKQQNRADRIEWEHIMPAHSFGQQRQCWQKGGRKNCVENDPVFRAMEADMHNLAPAVGEVNADRSNFRFGVLPSSPYQHGACNVKIDFKQRVTEPRDEIKGMIARTYFYMHDRYNLRMSDQQRRLMQAWDKRFPVTAWEIERNRRIAARMGHGNPFVSGR